jgi:MFS family permease
MVPVAEPGGSHGSRNFGGNRGSRTKERRHQFCRNKLWLCFKNEVEELKMKSITIVRAHLRNRNIQLVLTSAIIRNSLLVGTALFTYYVLFVLMADIIGLGIMFSVGYFFSAICSLLGGFLGDRLGRKTIVISGFLVSALAWLSLAKVSNVLEVSILYGIIMGAMSGLYPSYASLISDAVHGENVGAALGLVNTVTSLFGAIGAIAAGYIAAAFGFNILYVIVFVFGVASLPPLLLLRIEETKEKRHPIAAPTFSNFLTSYRALLVICSAVFTITLGTFASLFYPDYVKTTFGAGRFEIAAFDSIYSVIWTVSNYPGGSLYDKVGKKVVSAGYLLMGVAWLMFPILNHLYLIYAVYAAYSFGNSRGYFTTTLALSSVPPKDKGTALGVMNTFMYTGVAIAGLLGGFLWTCLGALASFVLASVSCVVSSLLILLTKAK